MAHPRKTQELEAAFREAGLLQTEVLADCVRIKFPDAELVVRPASARERVADFLRTTVPGARRDQQPDVAPVVIAEHFTSGALELLNEERASYLDDCRFVFRNEAPFVSIDRAQTCDQTKKLVRGQSLGGRLGIAVQAMLLADTEWWRVTELAEVAKVAAGTAQTALTRLEGLELVDVSGSGPSKRRRLRDKGAVLDRWAQDARGERHRLATTFLLGQGPIDLARQVSARLAGRQIEHAVTGACAALLVAPHLTDARTCEVWVDPALGANLVIDALGTAPVDKGGNVVVLQARTDAPLYAAREIDAVVVANPLRLYADLLEDPRRGQEQASFLRETVLGF
jgi:Mn-dependent DtxR family transcriptional regulator